MNNTIDRNEEREQVCSLLLKSGRFQEINPTRLQQLVAKANFHSIYFDLAIQNKDYKECLILYGTLPWRVSLYRLSFGYDKVTCYATECRYGIIANHQSISEI